VTTRQNLSWIPIEVEMPTKSGRYLACLATNDTTAALFYPPAEWQCAFRDCQIGSEVTHWAEWPTGARP
jgi:hypothetical protein